MRGKRRRLSPEDRRAHLLSVGAEVFGNRPYDEVQINEIAQQAGVTRALMYHYFPCKRAFFVAVVKNQADRLIETNNQLARPGQTLFEEIRTGVLAHMDYHEQHPHSVWATYVGIGRSGPALLGIDDEAKNHQLQYFISRITDVPGPGSDLDPKVERVLRMIIHGWLEFTSELCRQRIVDPSTDAGQLADICANMLLDAVARIPGLPTQLVDAATPDRR